jgi:hypothetical protein
MGEGNDETELTDDTVDAVSGLDVENWENG